MSEKQVQHPQTLGGHHYHPHQGYHQHNGKPSQDHHLNHQHQVNPSQHVHKPKQGEHTHTNHYHHQPIPMQNENQKYEQKAHPFQHFNEPNHLQHQHGFGEDHHNKPEQHHQKQHHHHHGIHLIKNIHQQYDYNSFKADDGNVVWAGALALAWKDMASLTHQKYLHVHSDDAGKKAAHNYNYSPFSQHDLKPESRYTKSGFGQHTVNIINDQRAKHFPQCTFPPLDISLPPEGAISYSYIYKKLTYAFRFQRRQQNILKFKCANGEEKVVPSFYCEDERQYDQIKVYDYNDNDDFIIRLRTNDDNEEVFAYKIGPHVPLKEVIKKIMEISKKTEEIYSVAEVECFEFPVLDFDYQRSVQELIGAQLVNLGGRKIQAIIQGVKLKLDETGVVVQNQGMMFTDECGVFNPRVMRIDSPFWLVMKEKDRHPYLCIRVNNL